MTLWHVIAPADGGGHNSLDYREDLDEAMSALRYWRHSKGEDIAIARGVNGEPLRWVFWVEESDRTGAAHTRPVARSVHATPLGAKRAYLKFGRSNEAYLMKSWGFMPAREW